MMSLASERRFIGRCELPTRSTYSVRERPEAKRLVKQKERGKKRESRKFYKLHEVMSNEHLAPVPRAYYEAFKNVNSAGKRLVNAK